MDQLRSVVDVLKVELVTEEIARINREATVRAERKKVGHRQRLHPGAIRWLLGARSELTENGGITHGSIAKYEFLIAKCFSAEEWDDQCAELWAANEAWVQSWHLKRWPHKRPPHTPTEARRDFIARRKAQHAACVVE